MTCFAFLIECNNRVLYLQIWFHTNHPFLNSCMVCARSILCKLAVQSANGAKSMLCKLAVQLVWLCIIGICPRFDWWPWLLIMKACNVFHMLFYPAVSFLLFSFSVLFFIPPVSWYNAHTEPPQVQRALAPGAGCCWELTFGIWPRDLERSRSRSKVNLG